MSENVGAVSLGFDLDSSSLESQIASAGEKGGSMLSGILSKNLSGAYGNFASKGLSASFKALKGDSAGLTEQIGNQKRAVQELQSAMEKSVSETGADSRETSELREKVEAAQSSLEKMSRSLKETNSETEKSPGKFSSFASSASGAGEKSSFLSGMLGKVKNAALGLGATIGGGAGLFTLAQSAVDTGNAAYELSEKLHISSTEATQFSKMLKISDTDAQPFISTMMRLDKATESANSSSKNSVASAAALKAAQEGVAASQAKLNEEMKKYPSTSSQVLSAKKSLASAEAALEKVQNGSGKAVNATTSALQKYGVSLTDAHGKLLPMNDQLAALAAGYRRAEEAGNDEAFTAEILGSRGTALTNIFANYNDVLAETGKAKGIGIDPNQAHRVFLETQSLKLQLSQLGMVLSNAVIPVASSIIPPLMTQFSGLADKIKNHQSQIQSVSNTVGNLGKTVLSVVVPPIKSIFSFISSHGQASITIFMGIAGAVAAFKTAMMASNAVTAISNALAVRAAIATGVEGAGQAALAEAKGNTTLAQMALNASILACPTTWWILGITAVVTAFALLWQNCAGFRNFWIGLWNDLKGAAQTVGAWFSGPFLTGFKSAWNNLPAFFVGLGNSIKGGVTGAVNAIKNAIQGGLSSALSFVQQKLNALKSTIQAHKTQIITVAAILGTVFGPALIKSGIQAATAGAKVASGFIANLAKAGAAAVVNGAKVTANFTATLIKSGAQAVASGAKITASFIGSLVKSGAAAVANGAKVAVSFTATMIKAGAQAVVAGAKVVGSFVASLAQSAAQAITTGAAISGNLITSIVSYAASGWKTVGAIAAQTGAWVAQKAAAIGSAVATKAMTAAQWLLNAAMNANPIGLVIAGIAALVGALVLLYNKNEAFRNFVNNMWAGIKGGWMNVINGIKGLWNGLNPLQWGKDLVDGIANGIKGAAAHVKDAVGGVAQNIRSFLHFSEPDIGPLKGFHGWWKDMMQGAGEDITGNSGYVMAALHSVTSQMRTAIQPQMVLPAPSLAFAGGYGSVSSNTTTVDNSAKQFNSFNGNYSFRDEKDMDYFMNQAALLVGRKR